LYHSLDGGKTWENLIHSDVPFGDEYLCAVDFIDEYTGWIVGNTSRRTGTGGFVLKTSDGGETWIDQLSHVGYDLGNAHFVDKETGWVVGKGGKIFHTKDGGNSWIEQESSTNFTLRSLDFVNKENGWIVGEGSTGNEGKGIILHTSDGGDTWIDQTPNLSPSLNDVSFVDSHTGWIVGAYTGIIFHTVDGGSSWIIQRQYKESNMRGVKFVSRTHGWVLGSNPEKQTGMLHTSDGGLTWVGQYMGGHAMKFIDQEHGWVVGYMGQVYYTENGGLDWKRQYSNADTRWLKGVDFINENTGWIVGSWGTILNTTTGGETFIDYDFEIDNLASDFYLHANYPNPFNSQTAIVYRLSESAPVKLIIYDLLGREIKRLADGIQRAGMHRVFWDGKDERENDVPSGIYFYRLTSANYTEQGKMILIR